MRGQVLSLAALCLTAPTVTEAQPTQAANDKIAQGVRVIRDLCGTGVSRSTQQQYVGKVEGGITLRRLPGASAEGSITYSTTEAEGLAGALQKELTQAGERLSQSQIECMKPYIDRILDAILGPQRFGKTDPPLRHVNGWKVEVSGQGAGGGNFAPVVVAPFIAPTPAAIEVTSYLPPQTSRRNLRLEVKASTTHHVKVAGTWSYNFRFHTQSFAQCDPLDFRSDGVPATVVGAAQTGNPGVRGPTTDLQPVNFSVEQGVGDHDLTVGLRCWVLGAQFPVISVTIQDPRQAPPQNPVGGEFTTPELARG